jgi:pectate lyase
MTAGAAAPVVATPRVPPRSAGAAETSPVGFGAGTTGDGGATAVTAVASVTSGVNAGKP